MKKKFLYILGGVFVSIVLCSFSDMQVKKPLGGQKDTTILKVSKTTTAKDSSSGRQDLRNHMTEKQSPAGGKNQPVNDGTDLSERGIYNTDDTADSIQKMSQSYENTFLKMVLTLLGLLAAVILTAWGLKKLSNSRLKGLNSDRPIKILDRRPLSPKSVAYLLEVDGKKVLVAESQSNMCLLTEIDNFPQDK